MNGLWPMLLLCLVLYFYLRSQVVDDGRWDVILRHPRQGNRFLKVFPSSVAVCLTMVRGCWLLLCKRTARPACCPSTSTNSQRQRIPSPSPRFRGWLCGCFANRNRGSEGKWGTGHILAGLWERSCGRLRISSPSLAQENSMLPIWAAPSPGPQT